MHYHLVARVFGKQTPFSDAVKAHWMWHHLRRAFPQTLAAALMPNHLHIVLESDSPSQNRMSLAHLLGRFTFVFREPKPFWQPVPEPAPIRDQEKLRRNIRYAVLNPCRAKLCADPLEWRWSTYRGSIGAVADPWVSPQKLRTVFGGTSQQIHRYVTSDPSVRAEGALFPVPAQATQIPQRSLSEITSAAFAAAEVLLDPRHFQAKMSTVRGLFVRLAMHQGWTDVGALAQYMQIARSTARDLKAREKNKDCAAAALCLGDRRLHGNL